MTRSEFDRRPRRPRGARAGAVRAPQGALGLFAARRRAADPAARQARRRARVSRAGPDRHQQSLRRAGILRQARRGRHPAHHRRGAQSSISRRASPIRSSARAATRKTGRRPHRPPCHERGGLRQPDEAREPRAPGGRRHGGARTPPAAALAGARGRPHRADRRSRRPHRPGAARGPARCWPRRACNRLKSRLRRPALRRDPAPRPALEHEVEPQLLQLAYAHELPDRRHQRGLLRHPRRLRGARCASVHRGRPLRRRGQPPPRDARARLQERRGDGGGVRRPARGARQHHRDRQALRLPPQGPQADPAALRRRRRRRQRDRAVAAGSRRAAPPGRAGPDASGSRRARRRRASRSPTTRSGSPTSSTSSRA